MPVRITVTREAHLTVLRIDGQLRSEDVGELANERAAAQGPLVLELSNLQSADPKGVEVLLELVALAAEVRGASPYIELLLKTKS
ncbi:MAG: hypothetical protein ACYSWU_18455 [Planctomycetota bacterium]|jgi:ABC-type transporter Mla MlaB component